METDVEQVYSREEGSGSSARIQGDITSLIYCTNLHSIYLYFVLKRKQNLGIFVRRQEGNKRRKGDKFLHGVLH